MRQVAPPTVAINLASDNVAGASPSILKAVSEAASGTAASYGADQITAELERRFRSLFECPDLVVVPVVSGTAANALSLAAACPSYGAIACSDCAHVLTSECGAPGFFTGGARMVAVETHQGRMQPDALAALIDAARHHGVHESQVRCVTVTQATEWGTLYQPGHLREIASVAHAAGAALHMDGARWANAIARLGVSPAEASWRAGVDILSFGATKNGALAAEAILVFNPELARGLAERRKQSGHLLSKQRFLSAQLLAYLADDLWLANARQANAMAGLLAQGFAAIDGVSLAMPVEANEVFARMPTAIVDTLEAAGIGFYRWSADATHTVIRMVTSFATESRDIETVVSRAACAA